MRKQEARQQREQAIIQCLLDRLEHSRVLDLTMSDIAKASQCSMGVIYSHFPSKEDLLLAASNEIIRQDIAFLEKAIEAKTDKLDALFTAILTIYVNRTEMPHNYALTHLAMNPNIWINASPHRVEHGRIQGEKMKRIIVQRTQELSADKGLNLSQQEFELFGVSLLGVIAGTHELKMSSFGELMVQEDGSKGDLSYVTSGLIQLLAGWGIEDKGMLRHITTIYEEIRQQMPHKQPESAPVEKE